MSNLIGLVLVFGGVSGFGWGEAGHHLVGRVAAQLIGQHPAVLAEQKANPDAVLNLAEIFHAKRIQLGHLGSVPDTFWRNIQGPNGKLAEKLGAPTHYLNPDKLPNVKSNEEFLQHRLPLSFAEVSKLLSDEDANAFFNEVGSAPWRTAQFYALMRQALSKYPKENCKEVDGFPHPTVSVLSYAGLLTHFLSDASMPYHATKDYDGVATNQKGIHAYFETDIVDALEPELQDKVHRRAKTLLTASAKLPGSLAYFQLRAKQYYPQANGDDYATALTLALLSDSLAKVPAVRDLDKTYALAGPKERKELGCDESGKAVCRRPPSAVVNVLGVRVGPKGGKTVAKWFETVVVERLAIATVLITDLWSRAWLLNGKPQLCHTWQYSFRPNFISPADPACAGYALDFPKPSKRTVECLESF